MGQGASKQDKMERTEQRKVKKGSGKTQKKKGDWKMTPLECILQNFSEFKKSVVSSGGPVPNEEQLSIFCNEAWVELAIDWPLGGTFNITRAQQLEATLFDMLPDELTSWWYARGWRIICLDPPSECALEMALAQCQINKGKKLEIKPPVLQAEEEEWLVSPMAPPPAIPLPAPPVLLVPPQGIQPPQAVQLPAAQIEPPTQAQAESSVQAVPSVQVQPPTYQQSIVQQTQSASFGTPSSGSTAMEQDLSQSPIAGTSSGTAVTFQDLSQSLRRIRQEYDILDRYAYSVRQSQNLGASSPND
ncbi:uncharacterized protein LOC133389564 isoform X3 [Rhineura floridana]|uniref:uncharacterized protein LOC133389564 isoform X3 n=1 Tax=Rhineura floridana TaxID=261503 RepID=UPI002AC7FA64|nr:uncharacterized protein LOC133389564 isoform X3 [Rhineura floridana]